MPEDLNKMPENIVTTKPEDYNPASHFSGSGTSFAAETIKHSLAPHAVSANRRKVSIAKCSGPPPHFADVTSRYNLIENGTSNAKSQGATGALAANTVWIGYK